MYSLSVLLDPKSSPTIPMPSAPSPDPMNDKDSIMSRDLPSPSWKLSRSPISPRSPRSPRSRTPPPDFESSFAGRNWEGLLEPHPILFRKRTSSSSLRETTTTHSVELHVQLQEADSTVPDQPTTTQETQSGQKRHCSNDDSEDEILKAMLSTSRDSPKSKPSPVNEQNTGTTDNKMDTCSVKKSTNISDTSDMTNDSEMGVAKQSHIIGEDQKGMQLISCYFSLWFVWSGQPLQRVTLSVVLVSFVYKLYFYTVLDNSPGILAVFLMQLTV